jgi:hypothetical protein
MVRRVCARCALRCAALRCAALCSPWLLRPSWNGCPCGPAGKGAPVAQLARHLPTHAAPRRCRHCAGPPRRGRGPGPLLPQHLAQPHARCR